MICLNPLSHLILLRERIKYLESENKFLNDDIFNKQKLIEKVLESNSNLVEHQSCHVSFNIFKVSKVVLSMEVDLPLTVKSSRLIIIDLTQFTC